MRVLLSHLILPVPLFWTGIFLSVIFYLLKRRTIFILTVGASLVWLFVISTPFIPGFLVDLLESKYHTISGNTIKRLRQEHVNILILGGGFINDKSLPPNDRLSESALSRLVEGVRINKLITNSKIITSGYGGKENISEGEVLARTALLLGVDSSCLQIQRNPTNTLQEALEYKKNYGDTNRLILVTSAVHMPRAIRIFTGVLGIEPIAAPTYHLNKRGNYRDPWFWIPSSGNIKKMEVVIHEYAGLLWYKYNGDSFISN